MTYDSGEKTALQELDKREPKKLLPMFRLGETMNHDTGIRYWGQESKDKTGNRTCKAICHCGEAFTSDYAKIVTGIRLGCGCKRKKNGE